MTARPHLTGFCSPGNPTASHRRCRGEYVRGPAFPDLVRCECPCHTDPSPATDEPLPVRRDGAESAGESGAGEARIGVYDDLPEVDYHADPTSVSASGMKQLLRSPAHYLHSLTHPQTSVALDLGTVTHTMILGTGQEYVAVEGNRIRNDVKAAIAEAEAAGKVVLKPEQLAAAERMADAVLTHPKASRILASPGRSEVSMFWRDEEFDVIRRCRWDRLGDDGIGVDLKTARTSDPAHLPKHIVEYAYDLSASWYLAVAAGLGVEIAAYALVFVESTEPHPVVVAELSGDFLERGAALAAKALATYRRCVDTGTWPSYAEDFLTLDPPRWSDTADQIALTIPERNAAA